MRELYIGVMSGTSQDGVDVALVEFSAAGSNIHQATTTPYTGELGKRIKTLITRSQVTLQELGEVNVAIGNFFGQCILNLLETSDFGAYEITAIGHSGHTVHHKPEEPNAFTMQIGDSSTIAANTGITTVGNFRNMDMAFGGQGAPLAPAFHEWCFSDTKESRIVVNIGGIANISVLQPKLPLLGFDTGPGNTLLDNWTHRCTGKSFDHNGDWSKTGQINKPLLSALKKDINDMSQTFMTLKTNLDQKDEEIARYKDGYDATIYKNFLLRFTRVDKVIKEYIGDNKIDINGLKDIQIQMDDALAECGVEIFSPEIGADFKSTIGVADNPEIRETSDKSKDSTIVEILMHGYRRKLPGNDNDDYQIIIEAKVAIYVYKET